MLGEVKWFSNQKGYGFILQDSGTDVFVHHTAIAGEGYKTLDQGEKVEFEIVESPKGPQARNVTRLGSSEGAASEASPSEASPSEASPSEASPTP